MTYEQLKRVIEAMSPSDLKKPVIGLVIDAGEFNLIESIAFADNTDNLEYGAPYLLIGEPYFITQEN